MPSKDAIPSLWDFSVRLYGRPGVARSCLLLQDHHNVDVNLLLFTVWWSVFGRGNIDEEAFHLIIRQATRWRDEVVAPARAARKASKGGHLSLSGQEVEAVYKKMLDAELALEQAEQIIIERTALNLCGATVEPAPDLGASVLLMDRYLSVIGVVPTPDDKASLAAIFSSGRSAAGLE